MGVEPDRYSCQKFHMGQGRWFSSHEHCLPEDSTHIRQLTCNSSSGEHSTLVQPRQASVNMWCTLTQHVFKFLVACEVPHKTLQAWRHVLGVSSREEGDHSTQEPEANLGSFGSSSDIVPFLGCDTIPDKST